MRRLLEKVEKRTTGKLKSKKSPVEDFAAHGQAEHANALPTGGSAHKNSPSVQPVPTSIPSPSPVDSSSTYTQTSSKSDPQLRKPADDPVLQSATITFAEKPHPRDESDGPVPTVRSAGPITSSASKVVQDAEDTSNLPTDAFESQHETKADSKEEQEIATADPLQSNLRGIIQEQQDTSKIDVDIPKQQSDTKIESSKEPKNGKVNLSHSTETEVTTKSQDRSTILRGTLKSRDVSQSSDARKEESNNGNPTQSSDSDNHLDVQPTSKEATKSFEPQHDAKAVLKHENHTVPLLVNVTIDQEAAESAKVPGGTSQVTPSLSAPLPPRVDYVGRGIDLARKAIEADNAHDYPKAWNLYRETLECFVFALKWELNQGAKQRIREKASEYMDRADKIAHYLNSDYAKKDNRPTYTYTYFHPERFTGSSNSHHISQSPRQVGNREDISPVVPNAKWTDVVDSGDTNRFLQELVFFPTKFEWLFTGERRPIKSILLSGPPGSGKGYLAEALANQIGGHFFTFKVSDLIDKDIDVTQRLIRNLFEAAYAKKPTIILVREVESLTELDNEYDLGLKRVIKRQLLFHIRKIRFGVFLIGSTSHPWLLDKSVKDCFERHIAVKPPTEVMRQQFFSRSIPGVPIYLLPEDIKELGAISEGYMFGDLELVLQDALLQQLKRLESVKQSKEILIGDRYVLSACSPDDPDAKTMSPSASELEIAVPPVTLSDFKNALQKIKPNLSKAEIRRYHDLSGVSTSSIQVD